jgi:hypothetical protein
VKLKTHPYADLFPMMTAAELDALAADIDANGLRQPIVRYQGMILDGRNRLLACEQIGAEPRFTDHEGDDASALALAISLNVQRRDLTAAQRAIVAAKAMERYPQRWGGDRRSDQAGKSSPLGRKREEAAKEFKVSDKSVEQAKALLAEAPDLAQQVETQSLTLAGAYETLQTRRKDADRRKSNLERAAKYRDAIDSGEMTVEEALLKIQQEEEEAKLDKQARELWFGQLSGLLDWLDESVKKRSDNHLAWYTEPDAPGSDPPISAAQIVSAIAQLNRILSITLKGNSDVKARNPSSRPLRA